jgi:pimeloyl-ACP methyl ester carboxylesterase
MGRAPILIVLILAAVALALLVNAMLVGAKTRPAAARTGGHLIETGVVTANVRVEGEGAPIVLIHGFGAALDWWDAIAPELARDHKVIRLDLIGHGGTEAPASGYSIERQAALVKAVLDKLGVGRLAVVGHSMGGEVATAFTALDPARVERLVLIDSPPTPETTFDLMTRLALTPVIGEALWRLRTGTMLRRALAQGFAPGFLVPEKFVADLWQLTYTVFHNAHDDSLAYVTAQGTPERLSVLDPVPPLLVIFGTRDQLISPESAKLFDKVPGANVVMVDGAGHSPMVEAPEKTLALVRDFLNRPTP